jgi:hypothetical protein
VRAPLSSCHPFTLFVHFFFRSYSFPAQICVSFLMLLPKVTATAVLIW